MTRKYILGLALAAAMLTLCLVNIAQAQTAQRTVNISWTLPTSAADGTPLTGTQALTKVQVFLSTASIPDTTTMVPTAELTSGSATTTVQNFSVPVGGTLYARIKTCNVQGCSPLSTEATKPFPPAVPGVPTNVQITVVFN